jgi:hypothetical protein
MKTDSAFKTINFYFCLYNLCVCARACMCVYIYIYMAYSTSLNFLDLKKVDTAICRPPLREHWINYPVRCTFLCAIEFCQMKKDVTVNCFTRDNREIVLKAYQIYILLETNILLCHRDSLLRCDSVNSGRC